MANLLPSSDRRALEHERVRRLVSCVLILISGVFVLGIVLSVPSFFVALSSREAVNERLETTRRLLERQKDAGADAEIETAREKVELVLRNDGRTAASETLERVVALVPAEVSLHSVLWRSELDTIFLDMSGSAATRNALVAFGNALRSSGLFAEVSIPIESLAPQNDLQFRLSLTLAQPQ